MRYLVVYNGILFKMLDCDIAKSDVGSYQIHIGQNEDKISQNRQHFWQKIDGDKISASQLAKLKQAETETAEYIELLGHTKVAAFESPLDGYAYPVKIGDTVV
ncbi:MAG: hypothetical protein ACM65L_08355 [Microcoleus sp.]